MAERFFKKEVQKLYLGEGQEFRGERILAVTKVLLAEMNLPAGGIL
jgi:indolepyruvate ferredoxin oxidoreductase alpha subunit